MANIDNASFGITDQIDLIWKVREFHEAFTLRKRRYGPFWQTEDSQTRHGEAALDYVTTGGLCCHLRPLSMLGGKRQG